MAFASLSSTERNRGRRRKCEQARLSKVLTSPEESRRQRLGRALLTFAPMALWKLEGYHNRLVPERSQTAQRKTMTKDSPAYEVRLGSIKATIWRNESVKGTHYNVTFSRLYKGR